MIFSEEDDNQKEFGESSENIENDIENILAEMQSDPKEFQDIDAILSILLEKGLVFDASELAALVGKFLAKVKNKLGSKSKITKDQVKSVLQTLQTESDFLLMQHALSVGEERDKKQSQKKKQDIKAILRRAIIYEAYKIMSPRQIAGESRVDNLRSNIIMQGLEKALKIENKSLEQVEKQYGKSFIKNVTKGRFGSSKNLER